MGITDMTAVELAAAIREGKNTAVEATNAILARIEEKDKELNCYVTVDKRGLYGRQNRCRRRLKR